MSTHPFFSSVLKLLERAQNLSDLKSASTRRQFVIQSSAFTAAAGLSPSMLGQTPAPTAPTPTIPSRDTQLKFNSDGTRRPFAGNTVICHLTAQSVMRDAMVALRDELAVAPFCHKLGLTSPDSYHMTIFPGANDLSRTATGWPLYVPFDAPIEECNRLVGERMAKVRLNCELPLRVRIDQAATLAYHTACTMRMVPLDSAENAKLRHIRDTLADVYGFRLQDHDQYEFHITMSYQVATFSAQEHTLYREMLKTHLKSIVEAAPTVELGVPEYCIFPDMFRFNPQKLLACSPAVAPRV